jgi:hypothetical protein
VPTELPLASPRNAFLLPVPTPLAVRWTLPFLKPAGRAPLSKVQAFCSAKE